jgi:PEP-CTERM motif
MMNTTAKLKRLSRHLLATTCLTLAGVGAAYATTFTESSQAPGAPSGDFGNTFATATNLAGIAALTPATGDTVSGSLPFNDHDYFTFTGEPAGQLFTLTEVANHAAGTMEVLGSDASNVIVSTFGLTTSAIATQAIVPSDGILNVVVNYGPCSECTISYGVGIQAPTAPEPSTFGEIGVGLGLAGAVALRRRRQLVQKA